MKLFRRTSAFILVLALLLSMSISVWAVDVGDIDELRGALGNTEDTNINVTGDIYGDGSSVDANGANYDISGSGSLNGVIFGGEGNVVINAEVDSLGAQDEVHVTVNGDVNGDYEWIAVQASDNASVTVNGNVNGSDGNPDEVDYSNPTDYSDGGTGIHASGNASVTVSGDVNGGDAYGTYAYAGDGIFAEGTSTVTVGGDVNGGSATADPNTEAETIPDGYTCSSRGGTAIYMSNGATVSVEGNVAGGSTNGDAGTGGHGAVIEPQSETAGSLTVGGDVTSGSAPENGTDGIGLGVVTVDVEGIEIPTPSITVGSYDSIAGIVYTEEGEREMTEEELEALKAEIKIAPKGESKTMSDTLWSNVLGKIRKAQPGDEITVNVYSRMSIPASVIEAVREYDVKLVIQWAGGDDLVITKDFTAEVSGAILLKDLAEMLKK